MVYSSFNNNSYPLNSITETYEDKNISDIIYETEINWNTLMKAVGIFELASVEKHGKVIYEAVDIKAFFRKIKEFFKGLLEKIGRLFKKIIEKVKSLFSKDKYKNIPKDKQSTNSSEKKSSTNDTESSTSKEEKKKEEPVNYDHKPIEYEGYEFKTDFLASETKDIVSIVFHSLSFYNEFSSIFNDVADCKSEALKKFFKEKYNDLMSDNFTLNHELYNIHKKLVPNLQISTGDDFNKALFKYFRNNQEQPQKIYMSESDIEYYGSFVDDIPNKVDKFLNKIYNSIEDYTKKTLSDTEAILSPTMDDSSNEFKVKYCNLQARWYKIILEQVSILITAHSNAIIAQGNQYKAALKKILSGQPYDAKRYNSSAVFNAFMSNGDGTFVVG